MHAFILVNVDVLTRAALTNDLGSRADSAFANLPNSLQSSTQARRAVFVRACCTTASPIVGAYVVGRRTATETGHEIRRRISAAFSRSRRPGIFNMYENCDQYFHQAESLCSVTLISLDSGILVSCRLCSR